MERYRYKAIDASGRRVSGTMEAANTTDLEMRLGRMGLDLITGRAIARQGWLARFRRVPRSELINFTFHLEQLLRAGVPAVEALQDIGASTDDPAFRDIIAELVEGIESGRTLSEALAAFPAVFSRVYVAMVRVGEESGRLPEVLADLADSLRWQDELLAYAKRMMVYPGLVLTVVMAVIIFLLSYLVPRLTHFLESMDIGVPAHTRVLIHLSNFFVQWWWLLLIVAVLAPAILRYGVTVSPRWRYRWDAFKLRIWLFGGLARKIRLARFANYFALMYSAGVSVLESLRLSRELMDNAVLADGLERVQVHIAEGATVSDAFARTGMFPPLVVRMMRVGESSGALDRALQNISYFYSREVREAVERLQPAIQPVRHGGLDHAFRSGTGLQRHHIAGYVGGRPGHHASSALLPRPRARRL